MINYNIYLIKPLLFILIVSFTNSIAYSQSKKHAPSTVIKLFTENDYWMFNNSDMYYTNGLLFEVNFPIDTKLPQKGIFEYFDTDESSMGIFLGQNMYTPSDIEVISPSFNERPYAGWTYVGSKLVINSSITNHRLTSFLNVGIIGSNSKAGVVQKLWHDIISSPEPLGWDRQISNDIGVNFSLNYERKVDFLSFKNRSEKIRFEFIPKVEIHGGTVFNKASIGATTILSLFNSDSYFRNSMSGTGINIKDFRPDNSNIYSSNNTAGWGLAFFASFSEYAVLYNSMLQGGLFSESIHTIHKNDVNRFYFDLEYGITLNHRSFNITYSRAFRTKEFNQQLKDHKWGQLYLVYKIY